MKARRGKIRKSLALFLAFAMIFTTFLGDMSVVDAEEITGTESGYSEGVPEPREQPAVIEPEAPSRAAAGSGGRAGSIDSTGSTGGIDRARGGSG